jgi:hypothetical protein
MFALSLGLSIESGRMNRAFWVQLLILLQVAVIAIGGFVLAGPLRESFVANHEQVLAVVLRGGLSAPWMIILAALPALLLRLSILAAIFWGISAEKKLLQSKETEATAPLSSAARGTAS